MSWELALVLSVGFASIVAGLHVVLPFTVKRGDTEARMHALEAANVELRERLAQLEQFVESGGPLGRLRSMSR